MIIFKHVQDFFESWGLYPSEEDCNANEKELGYINPDMIRQGINSRCYQKMLGEGNNLYGNVFSKFCSAMINATDDAFYLRAGTWEELRKSFNYWKVKHNL